MNVKIIPYGIMTTGMTDGPAIVGKIHTAINRNIPTCYNIKSGIFYMPDFEAFGHAFQYLLSRLFDLTENVLTAFVRKNEGELRTVIPLTKHKYGRQIFKSFKKRSLSLTFNTLLDYFNINCCFNHHIIEEKINPNIMSIQDYQEYRDQLILQEVDKYMKRKYKSCDQILCWFDVYTIDITKGKCSTRYPHKAVIDRVDYITLLTILLKHPDITFPELPRFISEKLYVDLLYWLRFPTTKHNIYPIISESSSNPIAVEMHTLHRDVQAIAGDNPYSFDLFSYTPQAYHASILVSVWMKQIEIHLCTIIDDIETNAIYGQIDVEAVKNILRVKTYRGIESALYRIGGNLPPDCSEVMWIIRWLDNHGIKYVHAEDSSESQIRNI